MSKIDPFVKALLEAANLNENQAKTLVYYCIMTWSDKPKIRPLFNLDGESSTGKGTIMKQIMPWCRSPKWIIAREITSAQLRDELADTITALVEEADKTKDSKSSENWLQNRYEETGREVKYRRQTTNAKGFPINIEETHNHFGYTVLHTQNAFQSTEMDRRTLKIGLFKNSKRDYDFTWGLPTELLAQIANEVDWESNVEQAKSNSAWDVWLPIMRIASHLGDTKFLTYAQKQIEEKTKEDELTKVFETKGIVLSEIIPLYEKYLSGNDRNKISVTDVRTQIRTRGYDFNEKQIVKAAKDLGFTVIYPQNKAYIKYEGEQRLKDILVKAAFKEENEEISLEKTQPVQATCYAAQGRN